MQVAKYTAVPTDQVAADSSGDAHTSDQQPNADAAELLAAETGRYQWWRWLKIAVALILIVSIALLSYLVYTHRRPFDPTAFILANPPAPSLIPFKPRSPPVLDLFVRTWRGDGHWLTYMLRSVEVFVPRHLYRDIIIVYTDSDSEYFDSFLPAFNLTLPIRAFALRDPQLTTIGENDGGYWTQMYQKWFAYTYSDADYFVHCDSDLFFFRPLVRQDLLTDDGRVYANPVDWVPGSAGEKQWRWPAQWLMRENVPKELMSGFPFVYPRVLYENAQRAILLRHADSGVSTFEDLARRCIAETASFSEFSTFGHFLLTYMPEWASPQTGYGHGFVEQGWSWGGLDQWQITYNECVLRTRNHTQCRKMRPAE